MNKGFTKLLSVALGLLLFGVVVAADANVATAKDMKIGFFDIQMVLAKSKWGQKARAQFQREEQKARAEIDKLSQAYKAKREELEKKIKLLDDKAKIEKLKELRKMEVEGQKAIMEANKKMAKLSNDLSDPVVKKILEIVKKIGDKEKYDFIVEVEKGGLVYGRQSADITNDVIKALDKASP